MNNNDNQNDDIVSSTTKGDVISMTRDAINKAHCANVMNDAEAKYVEAERMTGGNTGDTVSSSTTTSDNNTSSSSSSSTSYTNDYHDQLLNSIIEELHANDEIDVDPYAMEVITNILTIRLSKYSITPMCTDLAVRDTTFERVLKIYCGTMLTEGKSKKTVYGYKRVLERFMVDVNKRLEDVNVFDIRVWLAMKQNEIAMITCETYRSYLSAFFQWLAGEEFIPKNPMAKIKPFKYTDTVKHAFTDVEIDKLRSGCETAKERALIEVLLSSGVRVSELSDMKISDIDMDAKRVTVRSGKGGKQRYTYINEVAKSHLIEYLSTRSDDSDILFMSRLNNPMSTGTIRNLLYKISARVGMKPGEAHPHRFRRTFASKRAKDGMSLVIIQSLMGHANLDVTKRYIDMSNDNVKSEYERFA